MVAKFKIYSEENNESFHEKTELFNQIFIESLNKKFNSSVWNHFFTKNTQPTTSYKTTHNKHQSGN